MKASFLSFLFLFIFSLLIRLIFFYLNIDFFLCYPPTADEDFYFLLIQLYKERSPLIFSEPFYYSPLYFSLLWIISKFIQDYMLFVKFINIILGSLTSGIVFLIVNKVIKNISKSILIGIIFLLTDVFLFYDLTSLKVSLGLFTFSVFIYFLLIRKYVLSGIFLGLAILIYGGLLISFVFLSIILLYKYNLKELMRFSLPVLLIIFTITYINYSRTKDFILITAVDGIHFFIGNWKNATGVYTPIPGVRPNPFGHFFDSREIANFIANKKLSPSEVSSFWKKMAIEHMFKNKLKTIKLYLKKVILLFNYQNIPNNYDISYVKTKTLLRLSIPFYLILVTGISGFIYAAINKRDNIFIFLSVIFIGCVTYNILFFVVDRYRLPVIFLLLIFTSLLLTNNRFKVKFFLLFCSAIIVLYPINIKMENKSAMRHTITERVCSLRKKVNLVQDKAEKSKIYKELGELYEKIGGKEWSIFYYKKALELNPGNMKLKEKLLNLMFN